MVSRDPRQEPLQEVQMGRPSELEEGSGSDSAGVHAVGCIATHTDFVASDTHQQLCQISEQLLDYC